MKKMIKSVISLLLSLLIAFSMFAFAFAESENTRDPIIYVYGFGRSTLTKDLGTENEQDVFIPEIGIIAKFLENLVPAYAKFKMNGDTKAFGKAMAEDATYLFEGLRCDENGDSVYNISVKQENVVTSTQEYGQINYFYSDWRRPVTESADILNKYIEDILTATGKSKVCLVLESMGGNIGISYLKKYGHSKVSSIILDSVAIEGVRFFDELLLGNFAINSQDFIPFIEAFGFVKDNIAIKTALEKFDDLGGTELLFKNIAKTIDECNSELYDGFFYPLMARIPGLWSFITTENFEKCKVLANIDENSGLAEKINEYNYEIRPLTKSILENAMADGVKLAIVSGYNLVSPPLTYTNDYQSDFLVGTKETSLGATCAPLNKVLGEKYIQKNDDGHNHISPDNIVDASTCAFPHNTWMAKNTVHTQIDFEFINWIAYTNEDVNVYANEKYPQFIEWDDGKLIAQKIEEESAENIGFFQKIINFFKEIFNKIIGIFNINK